MPTITGTSGDDTLYGGAADDVILGLEGDDTLDGGGGSDRLEGGAGDDALTDESGGNDQLIGGAGHDFLRLIRSVSSAPGLSTVVLDAGDGDDTIQVSAAWTGREILASILAGAGNDWVSINGAVRGSIDLGDGHDHIDMQPGDFTLTLGEGVDSVGLTAAPTSGAYLRITDFKPGADGDVLDLTMWQDAQVLTGWHLENPFASGFVRLVQDGADALFQVDVDGGGDGWRTAVRLVGVQAENLTGHNFGGWAPDGSPMPGSEQDGGSASDILSGGLGDDVIRGLGGDDQLSGGGGNDLLEGGDGSDSLDGGFGDDVMLGGSGRDFIAASDGDLANGDEGDDVLSAVSWPDRRLSATLLGGQGDDELTIFDARRDGHVVALGGDGADVFEIVAMGQGRVEGGAGDDRLLIEDAGQASLSLGAGRDTIELSASASLEHRLLIEDFEAGDYGDVLDIRSLLAERTDWDESTNPFTDGVLRLVSLVDGVAVEALFAAGWREVALLRGVTTHALTAANFAGYGPDGSRDRPMFTRGSRGDDILIGGTGDDTLHGGLGSDVLDGRAGDDRLDGGAFDDVLSGGHGDDVLIGGWGNDILTGGSGSDTFLYFRGSDLFDLITDFTSEDRILVRDFAAYQSIEQRGVDTIIWFDQTHSITLQNTSASVINAANLIFLPMEPLPPAPELRRPESDPITENVEVVQTRIIAAGELFYSTADWATIWLSRAQDHYPTLSFVNHGEFVQVSEHQGWGSIGFNWQSNGYVQGVFHNAEGAEIRLTAMAEGQRMLGLFVPGNGPDFTNDGLFETVALASEAVAIETGDFEFDFVNTGVLRAWGREYGQALYMASGGTFLNTGLIEAIGGTAAAVGVGGYSATPYVNRGTIRAIDQREGSDSLAFTYFGNDDNFRLENHGLMDAEVAFQAYSYSLWATIHLLNAGNIAGRIEFYNSSRLNNTGEIKGDVYFSGRPTILDGQFGLQGTDWIINDGLIDGSVFCGVGDDDFNGEGGRQVAVWGEEGNDRLVGGASVDWLHGGIGDDILIGGAGDDVLIGAGGSNAVYGDAGWDEAVYAGSIKNYQIYAQAGGFRIKGAGTSDFITGVEVLRFDDMVVDLTMIVCDPSGMIASGVSGALVLPGFPDEDWPLKPSGRDEPIVLPAEASAEGTVFADFVASRGFLELWVGDAAVVDWLV